MPPTYATDFLTIGNPGKQLVDPGQFYQGMQLLLGYQETQAVLNAQAPGPLLSAAVNTLTTPAGAGPFNAQMPVALGGLRLVVINLGSGPITLNPSYNVALGRFDQIVSPPVPTGSVFSAICYRPGNWYAASVATGLPPADEPLLPDLPETEC